MERGKGGACKAGATASPKECSHRPPSRPPAQQAGPSAEQLALGEGWNHVIRGGRVAKATATTPPLIQILQPVTVVPRQPKVTATRKKAEPKKHEPKPTIAAQPAAGKSKKKVVASVKNRGH